LLVGFFVGFFVIVTTAGAFVVGADIMLVHHLPLQPTSHCSLFVLHQSPP
jgi:predicted naringenin-chalcone synthase